MALSARMTSVRANDDLKLGYDNYAYAGAVDHDLLDSRGDSPFRLLRADVEGGAEFPFSGAGQCLIGRRVSFRARIGGLSESLTSESVSGPCPL
eukprot:12243787-Heterocapsa_arctica.AAC.1